jgi:hypothetical protein
MPHCSSMVDLKYLTGGENTVGLFLLVPSGALYTQMRSIARAAVENEPMDLTETSRATQLLLEAYFNSGGGHDHQSSSPIMVGLNQQ